MAGYSGCSTTRTPAISVSGCRRERNVISSNVPAHLYSGGSIAPAEAVKRLKAAGVLYRELRHENLIPLEEDYNGFVPLL